MAISYTLEVLIKLLNTCLTSTNILSDMLPARSCTSSINNLNNCSNCSEALFESFPWIHLQVTGFIEEASDLSTGCLDYVLYWDILDTFSIIGAIFGGSVVKVLLGSSRCMSVVFNRDMPTLKLFRTLLLPSKSSPIFLKIIFFYQVFYFLSQFFNLLTNIVRAQSVSSSVELSSYQFSNDTTGHRYLLKLKLLAIF